MVCFEVHGQVRAHSIQDPVLCKWVVDFVFIWCLHIGLFEPALVEDMRCHLLLLVMELNPFQGFVLIS